MNTNRYFIAPDGNNDDTVWSRNSEDDPLPQPVAARWEVTPEAWALLVRSVRVPEPWFCDAHRLWTTGDCPKCDDELIALTEEWDA